MIIDLRKGFGDFEDYKLFKFPDNSIKFISKDEDSSDFILIRITLRSSDDIIALGMAKEVCDRYSTGKIALMIDYMITQQDDRKFADNESFGLKFITNYINSLNFDIVEVYHPHSDVTGALLNNCTVTDNTKFIEWVLDQLPEDVIWVIPDSGAFKTQFKQIEKLGHKNFITCMKSRDHVTGEITTVVNSENLMGKSCIIFDDLTLGGATFLGISDKLYEKGTIQISLAVSHGVFNYGIDHLLPSFQHIYTTDSICTLPESEVLKIMKL